MGNYSFTGTPQFVTVGQSGVYDINAFGAQGGSANGTNSTAIGGYGAEEGGTFTLTAGEKLEIIVGGQGGTYGGGGGTFVLANTGAGGAYQLLLVAGGGGGAGGANGGNATVATAGSGAGGQSYGTAGGGGGGSGVNGNGLDGTGYKAGSGGSNISGTPSYAGGAGYTAGFNGGFGGGGGAGGVGGGGGGGYTGGGGGYNGAGQGSGGTSFDGGTVNTTETNAGINQGAGSLIITPNAVCFANGTLIQTARGDILVEALAVGDMVITSSGAHRPIRWLGHRTIDCLAHTRQNEVLPIRISSHAFGKNKPMQDLYVSPGHSICVDLLGEVLVPAGALINGSTVVQVDVDQITYWHVELDSHDIVIANGLPAESFLDMGNRNFFIENDVVSFGEVPDADLSSLALRSHTDFCRPYVDKGVIIDALRLQLRRQAEIAGWTLDASQPLAGLHLLVDGVRVDPVVRGLTARFALPVSAREVWLVSTTARPVDVGEGNDYRQLGVRLAELSIDDGFEDRRFIDLDDPLLCGGFHPVEGEGRWTAGRALLPTALWADCQNDIFLRIALERPALPRWAMPSAIAGVVAESDIVGNNLKAQLTA